MTQNDNRRLKPAYFNLIAQAQFARHSTPQTIAFVQQRSVVDRASFDLGFRYMQLYANHFAMFIGMQADFATGQTVVDFGCVNDCQSIDILCYFLRFSCHQQHMAAIARFRNILHCIVRKNTQCDKPLQ